MKVFPKARTNRTHKKRKLLNALEQSLGIVTVACAKAGVGRSTFYDWLRTDPKFRLAYNDINDRALDFVESQLFSNIAKGDVTSVIFFLKTKGKGRGYVERQQINATVEGHRRFNLIIKADEN